MEDILKRVSKEEEALDSDDSNDSVEDIEERLANIDLDSPEELWNLLTEKEKQKFESLVESNEILKYLPEFEPWWASHKFELVQEVGNEADGVMPDIREDIPPLSKLTVSISSMIMSYIIFIYVEWLKCFLLKSLYFQNIVIL